MTPERAKELLPVIQAFAEGKAIERRFTGSDGADGYHYWCVDAAPDWNSHFVYRVQPPQRTLGAMFYEAQLRDITTSKWDTVLTSFAKQPYEDAGQRFLKMLKEYEAQT